MLLAQGKLVRARRSQSTACFRIQAAAAMTSTRAFAPVPMAGISMTSTITGTSLMVSTMASALESPQSIPR